MDDGSFAEPNELHMSWMQGHVNTVTENDSTVDRGIDTILNTHTSDFKGIGKIIDIKKDKELHVKFNRKPEAAPVAQKPDKWRTTYRNL